MEDYGDPDYYFPELDPSMQTFLVKVVHFCDIFVEKAVIFQNYVAFIGVFVNLFHLAVLTRKSMMTSSSNIILIGIAVSDLISVTTIVFSFLETCISSWLHSCWQPDGYWKTLADWVVTAISDDFHRCSMWSGIMIAVIRVIVIAKVSNPKYEFVSKPQFGAVSLFFIFFCSSALSFASYVQFEVGPLYGWSPTEECGLPENYTSFVYGLEERKLFSENGGLIRRIFTFTNSLLTQIIPCILFPILTIMLVYILRRIRNNSSLARSDKKRDRSAIATKLVTFLTISFFIHEFPIGVAYWVQSFTKLSFGSNQIITRLIQFFSLIFTLNTTLHWIICFTMSSQYQSTVKSMLGIRDKKAFQHSNRSVITVSDASGKHAV